MRRQLRVGCRQLGTFAEVPRITNDLVRYEIFVDRGVDYKSPLILDRREVGSRWIGGSSIAVCWRGPELRSMSLPTPIADVQLRQPTARIRTGSFRTVSAPLGITALAWEADMTVTIETSACSVKSCVEQRVSNREQSDRQ